MKSITIRAGRKALEHLRQHGLRAQDIAVIPAAAGGPKGLIFQHLDQWAFGQWLPSAPRERVLIGASVGAWRMAAACHADPVSAFARLSELYCAQSYPPRPSPDYVTKTCVDFLQGMMGGHEGEIVSHPHHRLHILAARGMALLRNPTRNITATAGFGLAVASNLVARRQLASHLGRVVIGDAREPAFWLKAKFDAFDTQFAPLTDANLFPALMASGTLPFIMEPVRNIPGAPAGTYWDGGLIDYHLALPYSRVAGNPQGGLVFYPHFNTHIVPGWFDKTLPWRRARSGRYREWMENVVLVAPSRAFLQTLTRGKLPDRNDFYYYGQNDALRMLNWKLAITEGERMRDDLAAFVERPDMSIVKPL
ncbi:patatin-like phospholipase family protein [Noviherbaspirillum galbum]|uniref:Patatin-like phospholipase family protein n=1 Tax=Noviherbaspirillum galbum TaxID=2709383 RepID=A0A6B3SZ46_9BURK|nr:patatin-like phospholipase family protein [Noviherbaspirillum galbum]NEX64332.1 patatin-like phospholipase family protein [Noviherbaspirillum galbum]